MIRIDEATTVPDVGQARRLFEEYRGSLGIDLEFQDFSAELRSLPGAYARPRGRLLLARVGSEVAGCVALRPITAEACEMKRLYVRPAHRAAGVGRLLAERVIAEARVIGCVRMCLDTLPTMGRAQALYESLGFRETAACRHNPVAGTRYLALELLAVWGG